MQTIEPWLLIPFGTMLLTIAVAPLLLPRIWENNLTKFIFTALISIPTAIILFKHNLEEHLFEQLFNDYLPFIILLGTMFIVTGGIRIRYNAIGTPTINAVIMIVGYILASFIGTTGAAMLLIRPLIEINRERSHKTHTILFFIALVANCGGILSPLGDPPLFMLYLRGASFGWFQGLYPEWATTGAILILIYYIYDRYLFRHKEFIGVRRSSSDEEIDENFTFSVGGAVNIMLLAAIVMCVAIVNESRIPAMSKPDASPLLRNAREIILILIAVASLLFTSRRLRRENHFSWQPIGEVAILFIGIFTTMTPALLFLNANAASLGISEPWQFYYASGAFSSILDNAPTAIAFHTVAKALPMAADATIVAGIPQTLLTAISLGAVFFGSMTYIGNGPNFMVKSIAEREGITMPSFFGYIFKFSLIILLPTYVVVQILFL